ncbi:MAG: HDIG domain-containing protein [Defluviitaleaceae bacterium]|nr:HDIG domain-containing protein [Defluviitaleaceae bacterium]
MRYKQRIITVRCKQVKTERLIVMKHKIMTCMLVALAFLATCAYIFTGASFRGGLTVEIGEISKRRIIATRDVENTVATERNRSEAEARAMEAGSLYSTDISVAAGVNVSIDLFFLALTDIRAEYEIQAEEIRQAWNDYYEALNEYENKASETNNGETHVHDDDYDSLTSLPVIPIPDTEGPPLPPPGGSPPAYARFSDLSVTFNDNQKLYLINATEEEYLELKSIVYDIAGILLNQGVLDMDQYTLFAVRDAFTYSSLNDTGKTVGNNIVAGFLKPNRFVNEEATKLERERISSEYSVVMLLKDQIIVDENQPITEEIYAVLENLGLLNTGWESRVVVMAGAFTLTLFVLTISTVYIGNYRKTAASRKKESVLLLTLYIIVLTVMWAMGDIGYFYLPLLVFTMLTGMLVDVRSAIILNAGLVVTGYFVVNGDADYLLFFLIGGTIMAMLTKLTAERNKIFLVGLLAALINFILSCSIALVMEKNNALNVWQTILTHGSIAAANGIITVILCMGSLPIWEALFGVVTPIKLLDLANPTNVLLRRLTMEAPKTYHHSLFVANLAESAAYDIGANPNTARAGGYYHDIGKLKNPFYFAENIEHENPHDKLSPSESVKILISHISFGLTLAAQYKLPQFIRDIIAEHHGTTLMKWFYHKQKELAAAEGGAVNENDFRYPFTKPQSKESAVIMLADTVEAAVRSMISNIKNINELEQRVSELIHDKLNDGQLIDSKLSIRNLSTVTQAFVRVLQGMYHERIPYPKDESESEEKDAVPIIIKGKPAKR